MDGGGCRAFDGPRVGDVEGDWHDSCVVDGDALWVTRCGVDRCDVPVEELANEFRADPAVRSGDEDGAAGELRHGDTAGPASATTSAVVNGAYRSATGRCIPARPSRAA